MKPMQQINLYQPRTQGMTIFDARTSLRMLAITGVALLLLWGFAQWQVRSLQRDLAQLTDLQTQQQRLEIAAGSGQVTSTDPAVLGAQLQQLQSQATTRQHSLQLLQGRLASTQGFTPRLQALARRHVDGVWLDHILLTNDRGLASIGGGAISVELVPQYLRSLAEENALRGSAFSEFRIEGRYASAEADASTATTAPPGSYRFNASNQGSQSTTAEGASQS